MRARSHVFVSVGRLSDARGPTPRRGGRGYPLFAVYKLYFVPAPRGLRVRYQFAATFCTPDEIARGTRNFLVGIRTAVGLSCTKNAI